MNLYKNYFEKHFQLLKKNIQIFILIPTLIGGLWQVFELTKISTSYLRFFSISQLVPDGILIIFVCSIIYVSIIATKFIKVNPLDELKKTEKTSILNGIFLTLGSIAILYYGLPVFKEIYYSDELNLTTIFIGLFYLIITLNFLLSGILRTCISLVKKNLDKIEKIKLFLNTKKLLKDTLSFISRLVLFIFGLSLIAGTFLFLFETAARFRSSFLLPKNLINIENLKSTVNERYNYAVNKKDIVFFNDKYIFIEVLNGVDERKILILEFDNLFEK